MLHRASPLDPSAGDDVHDSAGRPTSWQICAKAAPSRAYIPGLQHDGIPGASAGAIFQASMSNGKFHGMICTTPQAVYPGILLDNWAQPA